MEATSLTKDFSTKKPKQNSKKGMKKGSKKSKVQGKTKVQEFNDETKDKKIDNSLKHSKKKNISHQNDQSGETKAKKRKRPNTQEESNGEVQGKKRKTGKVLEDSTKERNEDKKENNDSAQEGMSQKNTQKRYIVFIGNLPFSYNTEHVMKLFKGISNRINVRMLTKKGTNEPRGCAFVEFHDSSSMMKALKLHHTPVEGRKINVEPTAGGGGKSKGRLQKLEDKKKKFEEWRIRWAKKKVAEKKQK